ncbi:MAG: TldD/PmbA family protein [Methanomicrobiales archaeon]
MLEDLAKETLDLAKKHTDLAEVYVEMEQNWDIDIQKDEVDFAKELIVLGVGVRVIIDDKMGFSYTSNLDNINNMVEGAVFNARANVADENYSFASKSDYKKVKGTYDSRIESLELEDSIEFAKSMIRTVKEEKCQPTSGGFSARCVNSLIANSNGLNCEDKSTAFYGYISVNYEENELSTAYESDASRYFDIDPEWIARQASRIARDSSGGSTVDTKDMDVILDYHAGSGLISTFTHSVNADNVQRGRSLLADKIGQEVASSDLTIYDDGTFDHGLGSSKCDDEGSPSQKTTILEGGVLKNFIYDLYSAKKGNTTSTGNGMRSSFADTPNISLSNFILDFNDSIEISDVKEGVLATDVLGAHTANPISGDFSVETNNAFKIENGEIVYPIKKAMISGNIFQLLKSSQAISQKTRQMGPFIIPRIHAGLLRVVS